MHLAAFPDEVAVRHRQVPAIVDSFRKPFERLEVPVCVDVGPPPEDEIQALRLDQFARVRADDRASPRDGFEVLAPIDTARIHRVMVARNEEGLSFEAPDLFGGEDYS